MLGLLLSVPIGISKLLASLAPSLGYIHQKGNPENSPPCYFAGLRSLASLPSLHLLVFL